MGNCIDGLVKCLEGMRDDSGDQYERKSDHTQLLLKRIIMLEERLIEQDMDMKSLKTILSRLEMRRLEDKEKIRALAISMKKTKDAIKKSSKNRNISWQDDEKRIDNIGAAIKDLRLKLDMQGTLLRDLNNDSCYDKDDNSKLIDTLERGITQGRKHLENLEDLFEPLESLLIDSDNTLRHFMAEQNAYNTTI